MMERFVVLLYSTCAFVDFTLISSHSKIVFSIYSTASIFPSSASEKSHHPSGEVLLSFVNLLRSLHSVLFPAH